MFQVAVCEDELHVHGQLQYFFLQLSKSTSYTFNVQYFSSGERLLQHYKDHGPYTFHILILDIEMKGMNGIETALEIRSLPDRDVQIMFLTSYPEYMMNSFDVQPFHYTVKPVSYNVFESKIVNICSYITSSIKRFLTIKTEEGQIVIRTSDIIALLKIKQTLIQNRIKVITVNQQYVITGTILQYLDKLEYPFLLIHRSVIINLEHVYKFSAASVVMSNQEQLPIARAQVKELKDTYARYIITQFKERG